MLLGIPGDNTYANYQEANRAFWRLTLLPLVDKVLAGLSRWLGADQGRPAALVADRDAITALAPEREALYARLGAAGFLTPNEKRAGVGLGPIDGGDVLAAPAPLPPAGGGGRPGPFDLGLAGTRPAEAKAQAVRAARPDLDAVFVKIWRTVGDEKVRASHRAADGQIRLEDEPFEVGDAKLAAPRDPEGPPEETINCRCQMDVVPVAALEGEERREASESLRRRCEAINTEINKLDTAIEINISQMLAISEHLDDLAREQENFREGGRPKEIRGALQTVVDLLRGILQHGRVIKFVNAGMSAVITLIDILDREQHFMETSAIARTNRRRLEELSKETRQLSQDLLAKFAQRQSLGCQV